MFNSPQAQDAISQALNLPTSAFQDDHFEAMVVIQMHVRGRQNLACRLMLGLNQLGGEIRLVVVVNHGQRSHDHLVLLDRLFYQILANKVPYGLRPVLISPAVDGRVELLEKLPFQGESSSYQITHCSPPETKSENRNSKFENQNSKIDSTLLHQRLVRVSNLGFRVPPLDFRVSNFDFRVSVFAFRFSTRTIVNRQSTSGAGQTIRWCA